MKKILFLFGTRPEAIKLAPLINKFKERIEDYSITVCSSGQHDEMLYQVLDIFGIKVDYDLKIMKKGQDLFDVTTDALNSIKLILESISPDYVFVHGDTSTTLCASIASFYKKIKLCHVEAGLRTNDIFSPFPEEFNRQVVSKLAHFHFCPTPTSKKNLLNDGVSDERISITGNTVIDALNYTTEKILGNDLFRDQIKAKINSELDLDYESTKFVLITGHRRENFGTGFQNICKAIKKLSQNNPNIAFVYPVHLNPNVMSPVHEILKGQKNIYLTKPMDYPSFIYLMMKSILVLTDSGGIQEEAPSLGKPVLVMRDTTERPEGIKAGTVKLVGSDTNEIYQTTHKVLNDSNEYSAMANAVNPYGDGFSCEKIINFMDRYG